MDIRILLACSERDSLTNEALKVDPPNLLTRAQVRAAAHSFQFGAPGSPPKTRVRASDCLRATSICKPISIPWNLDVPIHCLPRLLDGFAPRNQHDEWFIYATGPDSAGNAAMHFHYAFKECVRIQIRMAWNDTLGNFLNAKVTNITWEGDETVSSHASEDNAKFLFLEATNWVLGVKLVSHIQEPSWWDDMPRKALPKVNTDVYVAVKMSKESLALMKRGTIMTN